MAVERAEQLEELMRGCHTHQEEISSKEAEKLAVLKRIDELRHSLQTLETHEKDYICPLKRVMKSSREM